MTAHSHRPTGLHQSNKSFKSRHSSKGEIKALQSGKVSRPASRSGPKVRSVVDTRVNRKNAVKIAMAKKKEDEKMAQRMFIGKSGVPRVGLVIPLCADLDITAAVDSLFVAVDPDYCRMDQEASLESRHRVMDLTQKFKQKLQWIEVSRGGETDDYSFLMNTLDAAKAADFVVFVLSAVEEVDRLGFTVLTSLKSQGLPSPFVIVQHMDQVPPKKVSDTKKSLSEFMEIEISRDLKIHVQESSSDMSCLVRSVTTLKPNQLLWRDAHPYLLVDAMEECAEGTLKVTGYARGHPFSAERLVHIPYFGDFALEKIVDETSQQEYVPDEEKAQPLLFGNEVEDEQDDEFDAISRTENAMGSISRPKVMKRVPKGTSSYQAEWIIESDNDEEVFDEAHEEEASMRPVVEMQESEAESEAEDIEVEMESRTGLENDMSADEEQTQLQEYLRKKEEKRDMNDDLNFPDEVDTPTDMPARFRFRKYRGLKSVRKSAWDAFENLPQDYSRIFQFESFQKTKARMLNFLDEERILVASPVAGDDSMATDDYNFCGTQSGKRISLFIKAVPAELVSSFQGNNNPFVVFGLLPHEEKMSVLNMTFSRPKFAPGTTEDDAAPIFRNKDEVVIQCGFRRFRQRVLLSEHSNGHLHKMEKFLRPGATVVATCFGQIMYPPAPVLYFLPPDMIAEAGTMEESEIIPAPYFLGTGSLFSVDPNRIILKRKILSGIPTRIHPSKHRHTAIIRFLFHNNEDIDYFKPVELRTKLGRRGHILDSVGTHGAMKCGFSKALNSMDTVCLYLYKRVFPKYRGYEGLFQGLRYGDSVETDAQDSMKPKGKGMLL